MSNCCPQNACSSQSVLAPLTVLSFPKSRKTDAWLFKYIFESPAQHVFLSHAIVYHFSLLDVNLSAVHPNGSETQSSCLSHVDVVSSETYKSKLEVTLDV